MPSSATRQVISSASLFKSLICVHKKNNTGVLLLEMMKLHFELHKARWTQAVHCQEGTDAGKKVSNTINTVVGLAS